MITMTHHAWDRMLEFGLSPEVIHEIATRPDVCHTNREGESVRTCDAHPSWTVVLGPDGAVITVLRRTAEHWEHTTEPVRMATARPPAGLAMPDPDGDPAPLRRTSTGRRRAARPPAARPVVVSVAVEPCVLERARRLAGGDLSRLQINLDGTVTVLNRPRVAARR